MSRHAKRTKVDRMPRLLREIVAEIEGLGGYAAVGKDGAEDWGVAVFRGEATARLRRWLHFKPHKLHPSQPKKRTRADEAERQEEQ